MPYTIIRINGTKVTAQNNQNHIITRNVSHFKKIKPCTNRVSENSDNDSDDEIIVSEKAKQMEDNRPVRVRQPPIKAGIHYHSSMIIFNDH